MGDESKHAPASKDPDGCEPEGSGKTFSDSGLSRPGSRREGGRNFKRSALEFIAFAAIAVVVAYLLQLFLVKPFVIPSGSMENTLRIGDRVLVNRQAYRFGSPKQGDIIVFTSPQEPGIDLIKRVIAVGGDKIRVENGQVIVNDKPLAEPYIRKDRSNFQERTVPPGTVFVMGDNRPDSRDSRYWKTPWVSDNDIIGQAFMIYWPLNHIFWLG